MAFKFSLENVLRVRSILEEREERLLQKILHEMTQTLEALQFTSALIAGTDSSRRANIFKPTNGAHLQASYSEVESLKATKKDLEDRIQKLELLREKQMNIYTCARRDRESLSDMQEKKRGAYDLDLARKQQGALDDNFIARRGRF